MRRFRDGNELLLSDILGTDEDIIYRDMENEAEIMLLRTAVNTLTPREKEIICLRYGIGRKDGREMIIFSFLFVDIFDTLGTLIGVCNKGNMLDKDGKLPQIKPALMADAVATSAGAILGTSTTTTFVESSAGVAEGGRTGLTAVVTAVLFLISMLFAPIFIAIPSFATAPALVIVGFLMFTTIPDIKFSEESFLEAIPAYLCIVAMPLFYSISEGISIGIISYVVLHLVCGKGKQVKQIGRAHV